jgi:hypothetical protein
MKHQIPQEPTLKRALFAVALAVVCGNASALPMFTWNPGAAGLAGSSFTADNIIVSNFATVTFTSGTTFHQEGYLGVSSLQFTGQDIATGGLNSTYSLFFQFSGDGVINGPLGSLNYSLYGANSVPTFGPGGAISGVVAPILLAAGSLISGDTGTINGLPSVNAAVTFNAASSPFFVSPPSSSFYDSMSLTVAGGAVDQTANGFRIDNGVGSVNFASPIPEPETYALMIAGLGVLGFVARCRKGLRRPAERAS